MIDRRKIYRICCLVFIGGFLFALAGSTPFPLTRKTIARPSESTWSPPPFTDTERKEEREKMVNVIRSYGLTDSAVLLAMSHVPRHEFTPENLSSMAYADSPLPIGYGQTISQPYIVAEMTRLLQLNEHSRVLEVGTGSGYQAAILAQFTPNVFTMEIIEPLADQAEERLQRLGFKFVKVRHGDGYYGWPEQAPFDAIIVTAAAGEIPPPLIEQLKNNGRMVIPVGPVLGVQSLMFIEKDESGDVRTRSVMAVRFVPLTREDRSRH